MTILGIDQSYKNIGISVVKDNKIIACSSRELNQKDKTLKRRRIKKILKLFIEKYNPDKVIIERARLFSQGFISKNVILAFGSLSAVIIDVVYPIPVYSVDTRSWKAQILGKANTSSKNKKLEKGEKIKAKKFIKKLGYDVDDDAADSACIALYGFIPEEKQKLKTEM